MDGLALVVPIVERTGRNLGPTLIGRKLGSLIRTAHPQSVVLDVAVDIRAMFRSVTRVVREALEGRWLLKIDDDLMRHLRLHGKVATVLALICRVPKRSSVVINKVGGMPVMWGRLALLLLGIRLRRPIGLIDRLLTSSVLLGALDNELLAAGSGSQLGVSAFIVNLERRQLFTGDRERTGDCIVANGDLFTIHIRECIPPPLYPLGSAKAAIGSDDTVITTVIAPIAQRFSHCLLIHLLSCRVASVWTRTFHTFRHGTPIKDLAIMHVGEWD